MNATVYTEYNRYVKNAIENWQKAGIVKGSDDELGDLKYIHTGGQQVWLGFEIVLEYLTELKKVYGGINIYKRYYDYFKQFEYNDNNNSTVGAAISKVYKFFHKDVCYNEQYSISLIKENLIFADSLIKYLLENYDRK
jgi:hypothetical protein